MSCSVSARLVPARKREHGSTKTRKRCECQSLKTMSLLRLRFSTASLPGNRFVPPDAPFLAVERVNGTTRRSPLSRRTIIPTI
ncbi:hypothetical protein ALC56_10445 [Trachymyrmex septentrionalis]|uniref:Uncharacterized protein n=1 Tax=Trachymyrmex septentrionalis TaxID=34720 RepID=A0A195F3W4_9HYME|nr:hypothetical protein ALC56_10445 [Trachymyrmex septentrionalis]